jgi:hypothetical protein
METFEAVADGPKLRRGNAAMSTLAAASVEACAACKKRLLSAYEYKWMDECPEDIRSDGFRIAAIGRTPGRE